MNDTPLPGVCVEARRTDALDVPGALTQTTADGAYTLAGVSEGDYQVLFVAYQPEGRTYEGRSERCEPSKLLYFPTFYGPNVTYSNNPGDGTPVEVTGDRAGVDQQLGVGAAFQGRVVDRDGHPVGGVCVELQNDEPPNTIVTTDQNGHYEFGLTLPGTVFVNVGVRENAQCQALFQVERLEGRLAPGEVTTLPDTPVTLEEEQEPGGEHVSRRTASLVLTARRSRPRPGRFRLTVAGRLDPRAELEQAGACAGGGLVGVVVRIGSLPLIKREAKVDAHCGFTLRVERQRRYRKNFVFVRARFRGNGRIRPATAKLDLLPLS